MFLSSVNYILWLGLVFNALAGGQAVDELNLPPGQQHRYNSYAQLSYKFIIASGGLFIFGLFATMLAAVLSRKSRSEVTGGASKDSSII